MSLNAIDSTLQAVTPTVMVPRFEPFRPMQESGHRFLAAMDGLWLEMKRPWLYAVLPVARQERVAMPYGWLKAGISLSCGRIPSKIVSAFINEAMCTPDTEIAGGGIWNENSGEWRYERFVTVEASGGHVSYLRPRLQEGEHLVLDMHSHGGHPAFFSRTDDADDKGETKFAMVLGRASDTGAPELLVRLCAMGLFTVTGLTDICDLREIVHG